MNAEKYSFVPYISSQKIVFYGFFLEFTQTIGSAIVCFSDGGWYRKQTRRISWNAKLTKFCKVTLKLIYDWYIGLTKNTQN